MTAIKQEEPLDLPPPYSPTETTESSSTQPPEYNTIHEQSGFLSSSSTSSRAIKKEEEQGTRRTSSNSSLLKDIRYDTNRGPIGNLLGIAERFVGNAANAANIAMGAPPSHSPADFGTNVARSASFMANNASKAAMNYVGELMNSSSSSRNERKDERKERREERRERKDKRREERKERRASRSSSEKGKGKASFSSSSGDGGGSDSSGDESIHTTGDVDENDNQVLGMERKNAALELNSSWSGQECKLKTTNGHLSVHGSLTATRTIELSSSNGNIVVDGLLAATKSILVRSTNGVFRVNGDSMISKEIDVQISNAPIQMDSFIQAKKTQLKTKNGPMMLTNVSVGSELLIKTSNALIELHIIEISDSSAKIDIESSNAPVNVYLPSTFSGYFSIKSNSAGSAQLVCKSIEQDMIDYDTDETSKKEGTCKNFGNKSKIEVNIKTCNAAATLYI